MKKFLRYILVAAISSCIIPFSSCSDDDENAVNEWNMTYVSLLPTNYLKPIQTVTLDHFTGKDIEGTVAMDVMATIQKGKHSDKYIFYTLRFDCSFAAANTIKPQLL